MVRVCVRVVVRVSTSVIIWLNVPRQNSMLLHMSLSQYFCVPLLVSLLWKWSLLSHNKQRRYR